MIEQALEGPGAQSFREQTGNWVVQLLPLEHLVPDKFARWRPLVRDAMLYMFLHLSVPRLAPKLAEQLELPIDTSPEVRLLKLISKVPGLQKLGQVIARNRHLNRSLRKALAELENGISDVGIEQIHSIIRAELGRRIERHDVEIARKIFKEASVSAVVRFTWLNPETGEREQGVFKVMKPHIPECFAEDMELLAGLATTLGAKHREYGFAKRVLPATFQDVRRLLKHEVQFVREQKTLVVACRLYRNLRGVTVPKVIEPLCTRNITAMSEETGKKVTDAVAHFSPSRRRQIAEQLIDKIVAVPLFAPERDIIFHADPHAGNLLYDSAKRNLALLDWALTEHLSYEQRRHLAMFFLMVLLRDPVGTCHEIEALRRGKGKLGKRASRIISDTVSTFIVREPIGRMPKPVDAMDLLESLAVRGIRLPRPLLMLRKVLFTLDGILHDIAGPDFRMEFVLARHIVKNWMTKWSSIGSPLALTDWVLVQCSALLFPSRVWMQWAQTMAEKAQPMGAESKASGR
jgi:ubiquinone biosynthesis protein